MLKRELSIFKLDQTKAPGMEEASGNCEQEVLLAISRQGDKAYGDAILHAVRGPSADERDALRVLEQQGLISRVATGAALSEGDMRYVVTAEGNRVLTDEEENLPNLRFLLDQRIARSASAMQSVPIMAMCYPLRISPAK